MVLAAQPCHERLIMLATERAPREPRTDPPHSCQGLKTEMQEIDSFSLLYPCPFFFFIFSLIFFLFFLSTFFLLVFLFFAHIYSLFNLIEKVFSKTENRPVRRPPCVVRPVHPAECRSGPVRRTLSNRATLCGHRQNDGRSSVDCRTNIARNFREFWRKKIGRSPAGDLANHVQGPYRPLPLPTLSAEFYPIFTRSADASRRPDIGHAGRWRVDLWPKHKPDNPRPCCLFTLFEKIGIKAYITKQIAIYTFTENFNLAKSKCKLPRQLDRGVDQDTSVYSESPKILQKKERLRCVCQVNRSRRRFESSSRFQLPTRLQWILGTTRNFCGDLGLKLLWNVLICRSF